MAIKRMQSGPRMSQIVVNAGTVYLAGQVAMDAAGIQGSCGISFGDGCSGGSSEASVGKGNNLLNDSNNPGSGIDSGVSGGVPQDWTLESNSNWLRDTSGSGALRVLSYDWRSVGSDGCPDLNGNTVADPDEVVFSAGATEANNAVLQGWLRGGDRHALTSAAEHPSVLEPLLSKPHLKG